MGKNPNGKSQIMKIAIAVGLVMIGATCEAGDIVHATLEPSTDRSGALVMHITNVSSNTIRFLDIREGAGWCGEFYEVSVEKEGVRYESKGNCFYAPADIPKVVELAPGKTYDRLIRPEAYMRSENALSPPCVIMVTYRLTDMIKDMWKAKGDKLNLTLTFQTEKVSIKASSKMPEDTSRKPAESQH